MYLWLQAIERRAYHHKDPHCPLRKPSSGSFGYNGYFSRSQSDDISLKNGNVERSKERPNQKGFLKLNYPSRTTAEDPYAMESIHRYNSNEGGRWLMGTKV